MSGNISPIYDPEGRFNIWKKPEIFTGPDGTGQFVPKVDDLVVDIISNVVNWSRVSDVNIGNYLSTLVPIAPVPDNSLGIGDISVGVGMGRHNETAFVYINKNTIPYSLATDGRRYVYGSDKVYCKIFAGTDISGVGRVISAVYNSSGDFVTENVSLELVATDAFNNNVGIKSVMPCKTSANLVDGEVVTLVYYNSSGDVVQKEQFQVVNTAFIRKSGAGVKTVVGVGLLNPFLSTQNGKTLVYPRNLALSAENLTGVVYYNDGSEQHLPVDGVVFSVTGLDAYDSSIPGESFPLVVKYQLDVNEQAYGNVGGANHVSENYVITTAAPNLNYEVRLFPAPKWIGATQGYGLTWWLYDAARSSAVDVSSLVSLASDSAPMSPRAYGVKQTLKARINLSFVAGNYNSFVHTQLVDITLQSPGTFRQDSSTPPNWFISPVSGITPMAGAGVFTSFKPVSGNTSLFKVRANITNLQDWLTAYYYDSQPIILTPAESVPPTPTHFVLSINGAEFQYPLASWNQDLMITASCANSDTVYIRFQYAGQQLLELGVIGMPLYQRNDDGSYV